MFRRALRGRGEAERLAATAQWGVSETKRRAKFYSITEAGKKQLAKETANWERLTAVVGRLLAPAEAGSK